MRTQEEIKDRVRYVLIEHINGDKLNQLMTEPENAFPSFLESLVNDVTTLVLDEISFGRKR